MKNGVIFHTLLVVTIGLIVIGCAPQQTTTTTTTTTNIDVEKQAEMEYSFGLEYYKQVNYDAAIEKFLKAVEYSPKYIAAFIMLAKCYEAKSDIYAAETTYAHAKRVVPGDTRPYEGLGALYTRLKRYGDAIANYETGLMIDSVNVEMLNGMGFIYMKLKDTDRSIGYYNRSLAVDPEKVETMFAIATVYIESGQPEKALAYLEELIIKKPKNVDVRIKAAEVYTDLKEYNKAIEQYLFLIEQEPDNYNYHLSLGAIYQWQKKYTAAEEEYLKAKTLAPDKSAPLFRLADLYISQGKYGAAEDYVKQALAIDPGNPYGDYLRGDINLRRGYSFLNAWQKNKKKSNCSALNSALSYLRTAISYFNKVSGDPTFGSYARESIGTCNNWIKGLEEDKWFYCK
jgi:tetratricopeptide (TPR) repeat protein